MQESDDRFVRTVFQMRSKSFSDEDFLRAFEEEAYPVTNLTHLDHLRLAWIYLRKYADTAAQERMCRLFYTSATRWNVQHKFHYTITVAWMKLVSIGLVLTPHFSRFNDFANAHQWLLNKDAVLAFYSRPRISSAVARATWVEPDLQFFPVVDSRPLFLDKVPMKTTAELVFSQKK